MNTSISTIMKHYCSLILLCVLMLSASDALAHALWIETNPHAERNKAHAVNIYYGEYATGELEPLDKWYSDVRDCQIWVTTPEGQRLKLDKMAAADHYTASFTPAQTGIYVLHVSHPAKDLGGSTKYEFSSIAFVSVGMSSSLPQFNAPFYIQVQPRSFKQDEQVVLTVIENGQPAAGTEVIVMSEEGWSKTFKTDEQGQIHFPALWRGRYVLEASSYREEVGVWQDKPFKSSWHGTTSSILIK